MDDIRDMPYIAICGPGDDATPAQNLLAYQTGELLAINEHIVLTGGLNGVMAAAAAGCRTAGGTSIGFIPGSERTAGSTPHTLLIPTGLGEMRDDLLVRAADAVVIVGNSLGTLGEATLALQTAKPLIVLNNADIPLDIEETPFEELLGKLEKLLTAPNTTSIPAAPPLSRSSSAYN